MLFFTPVPSPKDKWTSFRCSKFIRASSRAVSFNWRQEQNKKEKERGRKLKKRKKKSVKRVGRGEQCVINVKREPRANRFEQVSLLRTRFPSASDSFSPLNRPGLKVFFLFYARFLTSVLANPETESWFRRLMLLRVESEWILIRRIVETASVHQWDFHRHRNGIFCRFEGTLE